MPAKILKFPELSLPKPGICAAEHYTLGGACFSLEDRDVFLNKAAAFQEIRDCLVAADKGQISSHDAERRVRFFVRAYLYPDQVG